jgi:hypothetical protein
MAATNPFYRFLEQKREHNFTVIIELLWLEQYTVRCGEYHIFTTFVTEKFCSTENFLRLINEIYIFINYTFKLDSPWDFIWFHSMHDEQTKVGIQLNTVKLLLMKLKGSIDTITNKGRWLVQPANITDNITVLCDTLVSLYETILPFLHTRTEQ